MSQRVSSSPRRHSSIILAASFSLLASCFVPAMAQVVREDFYATNGIVYATALDGNTLYVGGEFTDVAYATGGVAAMDPSTGLRVPGFPKVVGTVYAIASDGVGGWYLGGYFTHVGRLPRKNLAHVNASLQVTDWNPGASAHVYELVVSGTTVYVGGVFGSIGGQAREGIAALEAGTGLVTAWNPDARVANCWGCAEVNTIAVGGTTVYVGGKFDQIGGQPRRNIAALDATTDTNNATPWAPEADGTVTALEVSGTTVYAGGVFTTIGGQTRNRIAALDATTNIANATSWNPNATGFGNGTVVHTLAISGNTVYVGGAFTQIGGQTRNYIAALDATMNVNNATSWNPNADNGPVLDLLVQGSTVYVAGFFSAIGGQPRNGLAALDATVPTNSATPWNPRLSKPNVRTVSFDGTNVVAGGELMAINAMPRNRIASFDVSTGLPTAWNPDANGVVHAIVTNGSTVYAGGDFTQIGGQPRQRIAALDAATNTDNAIPWSSSGATGPVYALALKEGTLYVGANFGYFGSLGGQPRSGLGAVDALTGSVTNWNPNATRDGHPASVGALAVSGNVVYVGGNFNQIGGQNRNHVAAFNAGTGYFYGWNPNANAAVGALALNDDGTIVYAGGPFTSIGGAERRGIAALDTRTGLATAWNPSAGSFGRAEALDFRDETVYAAGRFETIGGAARLNAAALDAAGVGAATPWTPDPEGIVYTISVSGTSVFLGGQFFSIDGLPQTYLAAMGNGLAGVPDPVSGAPGLRLRPNQPNPFRESTLIRFSLADAERVTLEVFDLAGRIVATPLVEASLEPGDHAVSFDGSHLAPGVYLYRIQSGWRTANGKMVLAE